MKMPEEIIKTFQNFNAIKRTGKTECNIKNIKSYKPINWKQNYIASTNIYINNKSSNNDHQVFKTKESQYT